MKRGLSYLLAIILLLGGIAGLYGCGANNAESSGSQTDTDASLEALKLVENGKSEYVVVYPSKDSVGLLGTVDVLVKAIESNTGVKLSTESDSLRGEEAHDPNEKAILIGRTNYAESQEVYDTLGKFEYKIAQCGNKMVIAAWDDADLMTAVQYFMANLIKPNLTGEEGNKTLLLEEYHFIPEPSENEFTVNGTSITEFTIIYPQDDIEYSKIGKELQQSVYESTGVELPIYSDKQEESEYEILLGKTNRQFSQSLYENLHDYIMTYSYEVSGGKLQILSGGYYSAIQCVSDMSFFVLRNGKVDFADGTHSKTALLASPTELTSGADIRVMTSNLGIPPLETDKYYPVTYRIEIFAGMLRDYRPDAVGLQEVSLECEAEIEKWLEVLREEENLEYTLHNNDKHPLGEKHANNICMIFRSDIYECMEDDACTFSHRTDSSITMCHIRSKTDSSKEFILMNTHWDPDNIASARKDICSEETIKFVNERNVTDCPIFFTGDWNAFSGRDCLENFITATGAKTADTNCIEWTFYFGENVAPKKNKCLTSYTRMGDHYVRYTDFDLW